MWTDNSFSTVTVMLLLIVGSALGQSEGTYLTAVTSQKTIVELLIVTDVAFTGRFGNDRDKMMDYWAVYMWDVNMKFKTIPTADLSFRVTSLYMIQDKTDQPFIEQARISDGRVDTRVALRKFSEWLYINEKNFTNFDIAILVTGEASSLLDNYWTHVGGACVKLDDFSKHYSTVVIRYDATWGYKRSALESALGRLLGAPKDVETQQCKSDGYIMTLDAVGEGQFFFSNCSSNGISNYITLAKASCLWKGHDNTHDILKTHAKNVKVPSLNEQCAMITNNTNFTVQYDDNPCVMATCKYAVSDATSVTNLYPIDNTPCGPQKFCFRGRCLPQSHSIQNVGTRLCIQDDNKYLASGHPIMSQCPDFPTPLDQFFILDMGSLGVFLATPYTPTEKPENVEKYLIVDPETRRVQFQKYKFEDMSQFSWDLIKVENSEEFLLFHRMTKTCVGIEGDGDFSVRGNGSCDKENLFMRWTFGDMRTESSSRFLKGRQLVHPDIATSRPVHYQRTIVTVSVHSWGVTVVFFIIGMLLGMLVVHVLRRYRRNMNSTSLTVNEDQSGVLYSNDLLQL